jgi:hypothetical protein
MVIGTGPWIETDVCKLEDEAVGSIVGDEGMLVVEVDAWGGGVGSMRLWPPVQSLGPKPNEVGFVNAF